MGGHLNAYTSREQTVYYAKVLKKDVPQATELLSDILTNSTFSQAAVERERDVILREMEEVESITEEVIFDMLHEAAYVGGGLGRTILGPEENIKTLKSKDLRSYIDTHYTAPRMVVAAAGALDHEEVVRLAEEHWSGRPTTSSTDFPVDFDRAVFTPTEVRNEDLSEPRAHVALAFDGAEWTSPYSVPLMVLIDISTEGMSSAVRRATSISSSVTPSPTRSRSPRAPSTAALTRASEWPSRIAPKAAW